MNRHPILLSSVLASLSLLACHHHHPAEGPAERAGKHIDNAAEKTKEGVGNATEKTGEAVEKAGNKIKNAPKD